MRCKVGGGQAEPPNWVPEEEARESFLGRADEVPVFDSHEIQADKIAVIALDRFALYPMAGSSVRGKLWR